MNIIHAGDIGVWEISVTRRIRPAAAEGVLLMYLTPDPKQARFDFWKKCSPHVAALQFANIMTNEKNGTWPRELTQGEE